MVAAPSKRETKMTSNPFRSLDDSALKASMERLARQEREANADIILHLLLIKERRLHVPLGYDGIFAYCVEHLGFSRSTAYRRKTVMDKASQFPDLIARLRDGRLHLCAAAALAAHLTEDNHAELLDQVCGLSYRDVETLLLRRAQKSTPLTPCSDVETKRPLIEMPALSSSSPLADATIPLPRTVIKPLTGEACRVNVTLKETTLAQLRRLKELVRGKSDDELLSEAMTLLLDRVDPKLRHARREQRQAARREKAKAPKVSCGNTDGPSNGVKKESRRGRLADRDQVIAEADGRCTFVAPDGHRCSSRHRIEVDHARPWALGGDSSGSNLRPMCAIHNAWLAERTFGRFDSRQAASSGS